MLVPFNKLPDNSRIWIYQTNKVISVTEKNQIEEIISQGIEKWNAHGELLNGAFCFKEDYFLVIGVNQSINMPSGCSIDASTHWIKQIKASLGIDYFDRSLIYKSDEIIKFGNLFMAKKMVESGEIKPNTLVYNTQINSKEDLENRFLVPAIQSQIARYFSLNTVS